MIELQEHHNEPFLRGSESAGMMYSQLRINLKGGGSIQEPEVLTFCAGK